MNPLNCNDEEPNPEILEKDILHLKDQLPYSNFTQKQNNSNTSHNAKSKEPCLHSVTQPKDQSLNTSKVNTTSIYQLPSKYDNYDVQQLTYNIMKDYSQLRISKEEDFLERMKFDIYKRQIKDDRVALLVEQNKVKLDESERIQGFNRLIEDANRRIEAQENLERMKEKINDDLISPPGKKYKDQEWLEIYRERFMKYQEEVNCKMEEKTKGKKEEERQREEEELGMCKTKKAPRKVIEESGKRMYEESIKRKIKMENKLSKVNYEQSPSKYKKVIKSDYQFFSEDDNQQPQLAVQSKGNTVLKGTNKQSITEFNNKRFEGSITSISKKTNNSQGQGKLSYLNHNPYLNKHIGGQGNDGDEDDDKEEQEMNQIPQPQVNVNINMRDFDTNQEKAVEEAAIKNLNYNSLDSMLKYKDIANKEKEASKIVDHFFSQKYQNP